MSRHPHRTAAALASAALAVSLTVGLPVAQANPTPDAAMQVPWDQVGDGWTLATWNPVAARRPGERPAPDEAPPEKAADTLYLIDRGDDGGGAVVGRQDHHRQVRRQLAPLRQGAQPLAVGQAQVEQGQSHVGMLLEGGRGFAQAASLQHLGPAVFGQVKAMLDEQAQSIAEQGVVVDQQQLHGFDRTRFELIQMDESRHVRTTQLRGSGFTSRIAL